MNELVLARLVLVSGAVLLASYRMDDVNFDGWSTIGHARIVGTAHFASGASAVNFEVPGPTQLPESSTMQYRFHALGDTLLPTR